MVSPRRHGGAEVVIPRRRRRQLGHLVVRGTAVGRAEDVAEPEWSRVVVQAPTTTVAPSIASQTGRRRGVRPPAWPPVVRGAAVGCGRRRPPEWVPACRRGPDHDGVAVDRHGDAEGRPTRRRSRQLGHFDMRRRLARAEAWPRPSRSHVAHAGADHDGIAVDRHEGRTIAPRLAGHELRNLRVLVAQPPANQRVGRIPRLSPRAAHRTQRQEGQALDAHQRGSSGTIRGLKHMLVKAGGQRCRWGPCPHGGATRTTWNPSAAASNKKNPHNHEINPKHLITLL